MTKPAIFNLYQYGDEPPTDALAVHNAVARGIELLESDGAVLGADVLWVPPDRSFPVHAHPGDHLLLCIRGRGSISLDGETFVVVPGDLYMVPGQVPHAVGATSEGHVLVSIGAPHKKVNSPERMVPTDWMGHHVEVPIHADGLPMCLCGPGETAPREAHVPTCPRVAYTVVV